MKYFATICLVTSVISGAVGYHCGKKSFTNPIEFALATSMVGGIIFGPLIAFSYNEIASTTGNALDN